jgi:hypothetical protein
MERGWGYNEEYTCVSHEAKVQRPLLHSAEGPLRAGGLAESWVGVTTAAGRSVGFSFRRRQ